MEKREEKHLAVVMVKDKTNPSQNSLEVPIQIPLKSAQARYQRITKYFKDVWDFEILYKTSKEYVLGKKNL